MDECPPDWLGATALGVSKPAFWGACRPGEASVFGVLRRTIEIWTHRRSVKPGLLCEAAARMDRKPRPVGRLFDVVDDHLKEDRPR
jgi:hypothetical protein